MIVLFLPKPAKLISYNIIRQLERKKRKLKNKKIRKKISLTKIMA